jgi:hypothetical protein
MTQIAKLNDQFVRIVRTQETVAFSQQKNWVLVEYDIDLAPNRRQNRRWLPIETTQFTWVRDYAE